MIPVLQIIFILQAEKRSASFSGYGYREKEVIR